MQTLAILTAMIVADANPAAADKVGEVVSLFQEDGEPKGWSVREWNDVSKAVQEAP